MMEINRHGSKPVMIAVTTKIELGLEARISHSGCWKTHWVDLEPGDLFKPIPGSAADYPMRFNVIKALAEMECPYGKPDSKFYMDGVRIKSKDLT